MWHHTEAKYHNPFLKGVIFCIKSSGPVLSDLFLEYGVLAIAFKKQVLLNTKGKKVSRLVQKERERTNDAAIHKEKALQIKSKAKIF